MREDKIHKIEVHVAGICILDDAVLVAKRSPNRKLYPGLWECGGGQVEMGENFDEAVKRQLEQELGVIVEPIKVLGTYEILVPDLEQKKIPGLKFICKFVKYVNGKSPLISEEHSEYRWQPIDNLNELEFISGLKEDIELAHSMVKRVDE